MVLVIDNYDSFVHNLARYVRLEGHETRIVRNDALAMEALLSLEGTHLLVSPGPCGPADAGLSVDAIRRLGCALPVLGVCLGHQCIGEAFGARVVRARRPLHGKTSSIQHDGQGIFQGLPSPLEGARYHSLVVDRRDLPDCLEICATSDDGEIMALRHRDWPVTGLQFHPESVLTRHGRDLVRRFLATEPVSGRR